MTKGDRWKVRQGWRSPGWATQPSSGEPDTGEPDARKRARPVRGGAVGKGLFNPEQYLAGRLLHRWQTRLRSVGRWDRRAQESAGVPPPFEPEGWKGHGRNV